MPRVTVYAVVTLAAALWIAPAHAAATATWCGGTQETAQNRVPELQYAQTQKASIDLLLSDVVLPGMCGPDLAVELQRHHPESRVLFMSGYTEHTVLRQGELNHGRSFLPKPFSPEALIRKVRDVLETA